jgi:hypothetical protein
LQEQNSNSKPLISRGAFELQAAPGFLKNGQPQRVREKALRRTRDPVKFGGDLSSSESEPDDLKTSIKQVREQPWLEKRFPSSTAFATTRSPGEVENGINVDVEKELAKVKAVLGEKEYSDFEDDVTSARDRDAPGWSPGFLKRHRESGGSSTASQCTAVDRSGLLPATEGAVPMTHSFMKALNRIAVAQQAAFGVSQEQNALRPGLPPSNSHAPAVVSGSPDPQPSVQSESGDRQEY